MRSYQLPLVAPGVPTFCVVGTNVSTAESFSWSTAQAFPDATPTTVSGLGDGTVNARALALCGDGWPQSKVLQVRIFLYSYSITVHPSSLIADLSVLSSLLHSMPMSTTAASSMISARSISSCR
jgi:hypothetical protein